MNRSFVNGHPWPETEKYALSGSETMLASHIFSFFSQHSPCHQLLVSPTFVFLFHVQLLHSCSSKHIVEHSGPVVCNASLLMAPEAVFPNLGAHTLFKVSQFLTHSESLTEQMSLQLITFIFYVVTRILHTLRKHVIKLMCNASHRNMQASCCSPSATSSEQSLTTKSVKVLEDFAKRRK